MHHDASEATINMCLGRKSFSGGGLWFCGRYGDPDHRISGEVVEHRIGRAILHLGRHRHGADDIKEGERINLIMWARNSAYRGEAAFGNVPLDGTPAREEGEVDRVCLSRSNDRDYEERMKLFDSTPPRPAPGRPVGRARGRGPDAVKKRRGRPVIPF